MSSLETIRESAGYLKEHLCNSAEIGIICGTGLGPIADEIEVHSSLSYEEIPHFPMGSVAGHSNRALYGLLEGKEVIAFQGRFHYYEGHSLSVATLPVRVMAEMGVRSLIVTNAAGGLNRNFQVGDIMIIEDQINFLFQNPLTGENHEELGPRFPDMSAPYSQEAMKLLEKIAMEKGTRTQRGVYMAVTGPSYETRAELRYFSRQADAIGMSTVPEVITACHAGIDHIIGLSVITNKATGEDIHQESHEAVVQAANEATPRVVQLVKSFVSCWKPEESKLS
ncbi:purine-nucleoside phosphorylase [bacterium]|mgnify:CR=1 FL=1|jgi:purine-nucleoside phosphorylase|nr:purine-nucleoside phosphorylase [bacterium]